MPTAISLESPSRTGVLSWRNLDRFYKSEISNFVIFDDAAALYFIPRRFFAFDGRLENDQPRIRSPFTTCQFVKMSPAVSSNEPEPNPSLVATNTTPVRRCDKFAHPSRFARSRSL